MKVENFDQLALKNVAHKCDVKRQRFLEKGDIPFLTNFSRAFFGVGQKVEAHVHEDMHEVFFVLKGEAEMEVDGEVFEIKCNDAIWIEAGESHQIHALSPLELLYFGLEEKQSMTP